MRAPSLIILAVLGGYVAYDRGEQRAEQRAELAAARAEMELLRAQVEAASKPVAPSASPVLPAAMVAAAPPASEPPRPPPTPVVEDAVANTDARAAERVRESVVKIESAAVESVVCSAQACKIELTHAADKMFEVRAALMELPGLGQQAFATFTDRGDGTVAQSLRFERR